MRYYQLDANAASTPAPTRAGDAPLETLGLAARPAIQRFGPDEPWAIINIIITDDGPPHASRRPGSAL